MSEGNEPDAEDGAGTSAPEVRRDPTRGRAVFISYASQDDQAALRICNALRSAGIEVWLDRSELRGGDAWDQKIRQQIRDCALFIPIISAQTQVRPEGYFRLEWKLAVDRSHLMAAEKAFLVPVVVDATTEPEALVPAQFREVQWTRIRGGDVSAAFVERIAALLNQPVAAHTGSPERGVSRAPAGSLRIVLASLFVASIAALVIATAVRGGWLSKKPVPRVEAGTASTPLATPPTAIPEKSVAVLPFVDMSEKHDQEYFADGLAEELIDRLTRISGLRVPARTSSFYFKGKPMPIAQIARDLGVSNIVEGSVRKDGNVVRITAQLIRAGTGDHVWSVTYDRPMQDIFKTQDAIAKAIAGALRVTISDKVNYGGYETKSPEAFDLYLQAADQTGRTYSKDDIRLRLDKAKRAVGLDPSFSDGWAAVAHLSVALAEKSGSTDPQIADQARFALQQAIETGHASARIFIRAAAIRKTFDFDGRGAIAAYRQGIENDANGVHGNACAVGLFILLGNTADAVKAAIRGVELDPFGESSRFNLALAYYFNGELPDAEAAVKRDLELDPDDESTMNLAAKILTAAGKAQEALSFATRIEKSPEWRLELLPFIYDALGRKTDADTALAELTTRFGRLESVSVAGFYVQRRDTDQAFAWLQRAYTERSPDLWDVPSDPNFKSIRGDVRYSMLLQQLGLID